MNRIDLINQLMEFEPFNEQEEKDVSEILSHLKEESIFERRNLCAHITSSCWIVNQDYSKVLLAYHNQFQSYAWLGGHNDGEEDCLQVALKEAKEESGLENIRVLCESPFSVEIIVVEGHEKKGVYVPSHLHLNVTYLFQANDQDEIRIKEDENSAIAWFDRTEFMDVICEPWMKERVYQKLNSRFIQKFEEKYPISKKD